MPRTMRPARHADGTEIRNYRLAKLVDEQEEITEQAIEIKDRFLEDTYALCNSKISLITSNLLGCSQDIEEVYLHVELETNFNYDNIE
jgi:hypothetical protein